MKFREIEKILFADGWLYKCTKGSHNHYIHPSKPGKVTVPNHSGDIPIGTVQSIFKQAEIKK